MNSIDLIVVGYKHPKYITTLVESFEKFKPDSLTVNYIVVENSTTDYEKELNEISTKVKFIKNPTSAIGSYANGEGVEVGKKHITSKYTFVAHSDTCVVSTSFFTSFFDKIKEGYTLVGAFRDNSRINAIHIAGLLVESKLLKEVSVMPDFNQHMDVGDRLTKYCRDNDKKYFVFRNTHNDKECYKLLDDNYKDLGGVCISLDNNDDVTFLHLGRGTPKHNKTYRKSNKLTSEQWIDLCNSIIG